VEVTDYRNNVVYNVGEAIQFHPPRFNNRRPGEPIGSNVVANYFKQGPGGPAGRASFLPPTNRATPGITMGASAKGCVFAKDNYFAWAGKTADHDPRIVQVLKKYSPELIAQRPWPAPGLTTQKAQEAYELVLAHAGCLPRDAVTRRTVEETRAGTGIWGRHDPRGGLMEGLTPADAPPDADNDGMPDEWERTHGLDPKDPADAYRTVPAGASRDDRHKGYTYIEFYVNDRADDLIRQAIAQATAVR
jgi:pectate lyase